MGRSHVNALLIAILLLSFECAQAQMNGQQEPSVLAEKPSAAAADRYRLNDANAVASGLKVVPEDFAALKLAPGFLVGLRVLDDSDFTGQFRIDQSGDIMVPVLGTIHIGEKNVAEAREQIKMLLLNGQILKDPQVTLTILEYTPPAVTLIGEVTAPGQYPLLVPRNIVDVLSLAGCPTALAGNEVQITPGGPDAKPVVVKYSKGSDPKKFADVLVHPGDIVQVQRAGVVYVLGAVNRPGGYVMQEEGTLNVLQAISLANGTALAASTKRIYLIRRNPDGTAVDMELAYQKISQGKASDIQLRATDVLFVPTSGMKSILTNSQAVLASAASASIYAAVIY